MKTAIRVLLGLLLAATHAQAVEVYTELVAGDPDVPGSVTIAVGVRDNEVAPLGAFAFLVRWSTGVTFLSTEYGDYTAPVSVSGSGGQRIFAAFDDLASFLNGRLFGITLGVPGHPVGMSCVVSGWTPLPIVTVPPARELPVIYNSSATIGLGTGAPGPLPAPRQPIEYPGDWDGDQLNAPPERRYANWAWSNSLLADSDGDGLSDRQEDLDHDGYNDAGDTSTRLSDTDRDGLEDGIEVRLLGSNPRDAGDPGAYTDKDGDGLPATHDPDDGNRDTDGDRFWDGYEAQATNLAAANDAGTVPPLGDVVNLGPFNTLSDIVLQAFILENIAPDNQVFDGNGFIHGDLDRDGWITMADAMHAHNVFLGYNGLPATTIHARPDTDGDGLPDFYEGRQEDGNASAGILCARNPYQSFCHPNWLLPDSDSDGLLDGEEDVNQNARFDPGETCPVLADTDGDDLEDGLEPLIGTDPLEYDPPMPDEDEDGLPDIYDFFPGTDHDGDRFKDGYETMYFRQFVPASQPQVAPPLGDVNGDGHVSNFDAFTTQAFFLGLIDHRHPVFHADANGLSHLRFADTSRDGAISSLDALVTQSFFLNILPPLPMPRFEP